MKIEPTSQVKEEDTPQKHTRLTTQKVKEWLAKVNPKEEPDKLKEKDTPPKVTEDKEIVLDTTKLGFLRSALLSSLPKFNLPVFDGNSCNWPNWYGMFKALAHDQLLSKTQTMVYLKASVTGTVENDIAGMFFAGLMYDEAIKELRTVKTYGHGADLQAAANMQQVIRRLLPVVSER